MEIALVIVLIVLVVALFLISYFKKKKITSEHAVMVEELKPGDKVMTDTGVVGEVVESFVEDEYKYFVLKSGKGNNVGYFTVHGNAIYYVFGKETKAENKVVVKVAPKAEEKQDEKPKVNEESKTNKVEKTK